MKKVMLDPGHGGKDPGTVNLDLQEKNIVLKISLYAEEYLLNNYEVDVRMTRKDDMFLSLNERTVLANNFDADFFVSIHVNSHPNGTGFESFIYPNTPVETLEFQRSLHSEIQSFYDSYGLRDRGLKSEDFYVLRYTRMSAVLTENLFIQKDAKYLKDDSFLKKVGESHAKGIIRALGLPIK